MRNAAEAIGNVYLTDTTTEATALTTGHMFGSITGVQSGTQFDIHVAMADFSRNTAAIGSGAKLIVNVPKGFTVSESDILSHTGFNEPALTTYPDGSIQIVAELASNLGTSTSEAVKILKFRATAPVVEDEKIYVFFTLVHGDTTSGSSLSVGAVGEFPVQVVP
jgi:pseudouridine-5'-phosphate glycosidase